MRALQIIFLVSFAVSALVVPYLIFSRIQDGGENNNGLIIFVAVIFAVNAVLIIRKIYNVRKEK